MGTIATHNGASVSRDHNRRKKDVVSKEKHIHEEGEHYIDAYGRERIAHSETWIDMTQLQAYKQIFGQAIEDYNEKQIKNRHHDRCTSVSEYLKEIKQHEHKHPIYEMCVGVYGEDSTHEQKIEILREFYATWEERNPNLILVGAYLHDDEMGEVAIHLDYIPIYHCERGLGIKQGLNKALEEQGVEIPVENQGRFDKQHTRQVAWTKSQNEYLESLCNARGIRIEHPMRDSEMEYVHLSTKDYIAKQQAKEIRELKEEIGELQASATKIVENQNKTIQKLNEEKSTMMRREEKFKEKIGEIVQLYNKQVDENRELKEENERLDKELHYHPIDKYTAKENEWASDWDLQR